MSDQSLQTKAKTQPLLSVFHREEEGGLIFSSSVAIIAFALLIGFLANMGAETIEREKMQHAADSVAYSSAVWLARGMNTTCAINHVLGELTAYCVIYEAFGGPEHSFKPCKEEAEMNDRLKNGRYKELSPCPAWKSADKQLVNLVIDTFTDHETHTAGAACYDAELTLKYYAILCLSTKAQATLLYEIGKVIPYIGKALQATAIAVHAIVNLVIPELILEYVQIRALEMFLPTTHTFRGALLGYICSVALQANTVVGSPLSTARLIPQAIDDTNKAIWKVYDFESYAVAPTTTFYPFIQGTPVRQILPLLPVLPEPGPKKDKNSAYLKWLEYKPWEGETNFNTNIRPNSPNIKMPSNPYNKLPQIPWTGTDEGGGLLKHVLQGCEEINRLTRWVRKVVNMFEPLYFFKREPRWMRQTKDFLSQIAALHVPPNWKPGKYGYRNNPSVWSYPVDTFDYNEAKISQWVRGAYPVVDSLRSGLRKHYSTSNPLSIGDLIGKLSSFIVTAVASSIFNPIGDMGMLNSIMGDFVNNAINDSINKLTSIDKLINDASNIQTSQPVPLSNLSTYMTAWSYRYTLSESYYIRSADKRPYGNPRVGGISLPIRLPPCSMYTLALSDAKSKGNEIWTKPVIGKPYIEQMFTVIAAVEAKKHAPVAAEHFFKRRGQTRGNVTVAQAMYYPAAARNSNAFGQLNVKKNQTQPDTGWDTLQWKNTKPGQPPVFAAPEWSNGNPKKGPGKWDVGPLPSWTLLRPKDTIESSKIQLNWQAMLSPVTKQRLELLSQEKNAGTDVKNAAKNAAKYSELISH